MKILRIALMSTIAVSALITPSTTWANWLYQEHGSAFDNEKTHIALVSSGKYAFGLRCSTSDDLTYIFITPEQTTLDAINTLNEFPLEILARIDQNKALILSAEAGITDEKLVLFGDGQTSLANQINKANSSISIATRVFDILYHETKFDVRGSTAAISKLAKACGFLLP